MSAHGQQELITKLAGPSSEAGEQVASRACEAPQDRKKILFASKLTEWPISAMLKADVYASFLAADLFVLQVSKPGQKGPFRKAGARAAIRALERWMDDRDKALARCNYILPGEFASERLVIRQGDFVGEVVRAVAELGAELVVIAPQKRGNGMAATQIALAARVPVLIARPPRSHNIVMAATNLVDGRYPVIKQAGQIRGFLGAQLVLFHNVTPLNISSGWERGTPLNLYFNPDLEARSSARLQRVARQFPRCTAAVVKSSLNTAQAILEAGRECDADLIVVGALRQSSRFEQILGGGVAARVAEMAWRSVLVTPISTQVAGASVGPGST